MLGEQDPGPRLRTLTDRSAHGPRISDRYHGASSWSLATNSACAASSNSGGASVRFPTRTPTSSKNRSCPAGEHMHKSRAGRSEALVNECGALAGTLTVSPARNVGFSPRKVASISPSSTENISSKSWRCGGGGAPRGGGAWGGGGGGGGGPPPRRGGGGGP